MQPAFPSPFIVYFTALFFDLLLFCKLVVFHHSDKSIGHHLLKIYSGYFDKCKSLPLNFLKHTHSYSPENLKFVFGSKQLGPQITKLLWLTLSSCKIGFSPASHSSFQHHWGKNPRSWGWTPTGPRHTYYLKTRRLFTASTQQPWAATQGLSGDAHQIKIQSARFEDRHGKMLNHILSPVLRLT